MLLSIQTGYLIPCWMKCKMVSHSEKKSLETSNKVKHESESVSCSVMSDSLDPMDCSLSGSSVHRDSPGRNTGVGCHSLLQGIFLTQGLKVKHTWSLLHSNCFSGHLSQRNKSLFWHKNFYTDVISTFICNSPKWNNPDVLQLSVQSNQPFTLWDTTLQCKETEYWYTQNLDGSQVYYDEWKKSVSTGHLLYDCICITL